MAVQPDLALGDGADRQVRGVRRVVDLGAGIAADIRIDSRLQPHRMKAVGQRPETRLVRAYIACAACAACGRDTGRRKLAGTDDHAAVRAPPLQPPAVIDVDVAIAHAGEPGVDQRLGRAKDLLLVDVAVERIPAVPPHRRHRRLPLLVGAPLTGRGERIGDGGPRDRRGRQQRGDRQRPATGRGGSR